jgi:hypothetical protein
MSGSLQLSDVTTASSRFSLGPRSGSRRPRLPWTAFSSCLGQWWPVHHMWSLAVAIDEIGDRVDGFGFDSEVTMRRLRLTGR